MADTVVGAVAEKYAGLAFTGKPPLFFGRAPAKADGDQVVLPYVVLTVEDGGNERLTASKVLESYRLTFEVWSADGLGDVDAIARGIRYGAGGRADRLGFDDGTLDTGSDWSVNLLTQTGQPTLLDPQRGKNNELVYGARVTYLLEIIRQ